MMKVNYKIVEFRPEVEWMSVEFTNPDRPNEPWVRNFSLPDFTRDKLIDHLRAVASRLAGTWSRAPEHSIDLSVPESGELDVEPELYLPYEPNPQYEPEPEWDEWTQDLIPGEIVDARQETIPWIVLDLTPEQQAERLENAAAGAREQRDFLLLKSDHIFCTDVEVKDRDAWMDYRQALRDLPNQPNFPKEFDWPVPPGEHKQTDLFEAES
jgi:hypothetical protein